MSKLVINLEKRMRDMGLTQKGLALKAGLNETAVRDILQGRSRDPQLSTLRALSRVLRCGVEDLFQDNARPRAGLAESAKGRLFSNGKRRWLFFRFLGLLLQCRAQDVAQ